jgi:hypothetical protein
MPRTRHVSRTKSVDAVVRDGVTSSWSDAYHSLVATSWPRFLGLIILAYASINVAFAIAYMLAPGAIAHARPARAPDSRTPSRSGGRGCWSVATGIRPSSRALAPPISSTSPPESR